MNKTAQIIIYIFAAMASFVFFLIWLFPLESVIGYHLARVEKLSEGEYSVAVSDIDASLLFDSEFTDFRVYQKGVEVFYAPSLEAGISLFKLLGSDVDVSFEASYKKGALSGRVAFEIDGSNIIPNILDLDINKLSLADLGFVNILLTGAGVPTSLAGMLNGTLTIKMARNAAETQATIRLSIEDCRAAGFVVPGTSLKLPDLVLAGEERPVVVDAVLENSKLTFAKLSIPGPDIGLDLTGSARLNPRYDISRIDLEGKFSFSKAVETTFMEDKQIGMFVNEDVLNEYRGEDGAYGLSIKGTESSPRILIGSGENPLDIMAMIKQFKTE